MYTQSMFLSKNKKIVRNFHMKIVIFTGMKNRYMLHGRVFVMLQFEQTLSSRFIIVIKGRGKDG